MGRQMDTFFNRISSFLGKFNFVFGSSRLDPIADLRSCFSPLGLPLEALVLASIFEGLLAPRASPFWRSAALWAPLEDF